MARAKKQGEFRFLNVNLPVELLDRLDNYSDETRIPKVAIAEIALREYLDKVAPVENTKKEIRIGIHHGS